MNHDPICPNEHYPPAKCHGCHLIGLAREDERKRRQTDSQFVLRLAALPRPAGEQHEMNPPHHLCLGDDPCICIHLAACEQRVLRDVIDAIEAEQRSFPDDPYVRRVGLGIAKAAVNKLREGRA